MRLLLDTHILLWWLVDSDRLTPTQIADLERSEASGDPLAIAAITFWEIAKLVELGRLSLQTSVDELFEQLEAHPGIAVLPLSPRVALESTRLGPTFHRDPSDQLIAATARVHGLRLVTADSRIRRSHVVSVV